jgi:hypothetical protein
MVWKLQFVTKLDFHIFNEDPYYFHSNKDFKKSIVKDSALNFAIDKE